MITKASATSRAVTTDPTARELLDSTERRMYDAETALHAAQQTHVDAWVAAAYDRLHEAVMAHTAALRSALAV